MTSVRRKLTESSFILVHFEWQLKLDFLIKFQKFKFTFQQIPNLYLPLMIFKNLIENSPSELHYHHKSFLVPSHSNLSILNQFSQFVPVVFAPFYASTMLVQVPQLRIPSAKSRKTRTGVSERKN